MLRKTDLERMNTVLYVTLEVVRIVAILAQPVMPSSSAKLLEVLGQPEGESRRFAAVATPPIVAGTELPRPPGARLPALRRTRRGVDPLSHNSHKQKRSLTSFRSVRG